MKTRTRFILSAISTLLLAQNASAQVPQLVNYQGRVAVGTVNFEGTGQFRFALVNAAGTTVYWSNTADTAPADGVPDTAVSLPVSKGLYSVLLGDTSVAGMAAIPGSVWANSDVRLRVWFNDGTNGNQLLTPDQRLAPNGYLPDGSVASAALAANAVTSAKIASGAVTNTQLATGIDASKITIGTFPALSGTNLTGLTAGNITIGTLSDLRLSGNVALLDRPTQNFTGTVTTSGGLTSSGNIRINGNNTIYVQGGADTNHGLRYSSAPIDGPMLFGYGGGALGSAGGSTVALRWDALGNVGIGTTTPASRLQVVGTVTATAFSGNLTGNVTGSAASFTGSLAGDVTGTQSATAISAATVTGKALTGFSSTTGTVTASDTILSAFNKLDGNIALKSPLASPTFTGTVTVPSNGLVVGTNQLVASGGNVGIGTTSPVSKLHVAGTITAPTLADAGAGLEFKVNGQRALRLEYALEDNGGGVIEESVNVIGGWSGNSVGAGVIGATIAGGGELEAAFGGSYSIPNRVLANFGTVGGGYGNTASGGKATVCGGRNNTASGDESTVGGGELNTASADSAAIVGGFFNTASGYSSIVGGGNHNTASGDISTVPGGIENTASGIVSFAAGRRAKATHNGSFVWGDSTFADVTSSADNEFTVRASGGVRFFSNSAATVGVSLAANGTAWATISDRNAKKNFRPVDGQAVLEKLAAVPVQQWNYKTEPDDAVPHLGPMAQEFKAAFYPGRDDKTITTLEFDGVELAAIQALNEKLKAKDAEIAALKQRLADNDARDKALEARLARIEAAAPAPQPVKVALKK